MFVVWEDFNILEGTGDTGATGGGTESEGEWGNGNDAKETYRSSKSYFFNDYEPTISDEENAYE